MKDKEAQEREEERMAELASMSPGERALLEQKEAEWKSWFFGVSQSEFEKLLVQNEAE